MRVIDAVMETTADVSSVNPSSERMRNSRRQLSRRPLPSSTLSWYGSLPARNSWAVAGSYQQPDCREADVELLRLQTELSGHVDDHLDERARHQRQEVRHDKLQALEGHADEALATRHKAFSQLTRKYIGNTLFSHARFGSAVRSHKMTKSRAVLMTSSSRSFKVKTWPRTQYLASLLTDTLVQCICSNLNCARYMATTTNADQRKWRQSFTVAKRFRWPALDEWSHFQGRKFVLAAPPFAWIANRRPVPFPKRAVTSPLRIQGKIQGKF